MKHIAYVYNKEIELDELIMQWSDKDLKAFMKTEIVSDNE